MTNNDSFGWQLEDQGYRFIGAIIKIKPTSKQLFEEV